MKTQEALIEPRKLNWPLPIPAADLEVLRRLLKKVRRRHGHWLWQGYRDRKGYGQIWVHSRACWAHRVAYTLFHGAIPEGMTVEHTCRRTGCVHPEHLTLVTLNENAAIGNRNRKVPF